MGFEAGGGSVTTFGRTPAELREDLDRLRKVERDARGITVSPSGKVFHQVRAEIAELEAALAGRVGR